MNRNPWQSLPNIYFLFFFHGKDQKQPVMFLRFNTFHFHHSYFFCEYTEHAALLCIFSDSFLGNYHQLLTHWKRISDSPLAEGFWGVSWVDLRTLKWRRWKGFQGILKDPKVLKTLKNFAEFRCFKVDKSAEKEIWFQRIFLPHFKNFWVNLLMHH